MGNEADYLDSSYEPDLNDLLIWGVINDAEVGQVENEWGMRTYMKAHVRIYLDKINNTWLDLYIPSIDEDESCVNVTMHGSIMQVDMENILDILKKFDFYYNQEINCYTVRIVNYQKELRDILNTFRRLDAREIKVKLRIGKNRAGTNECRVKFNRAPLEKYKKRLRDFGFRYSPNGSHWVCSRKQGKTDFSDVVKYFQKQDNIQLV